MKKAIKYTGLLSMAMLSMSLQAQTINFETQNYKAIGVYDTWISSPFRTGALSGNVAVVDNHLADADANSTGKMLGVQRSRFGSNTFGVRIDLNETFELTPTVRYAHVLFHKPVAGRVMLIGLGKRSDRADQSAEVEQFWSYPVNDVKTGEWFDAVFPIKGNGGIDIHSLVIVPDCEAPHALDADFVAYIDEIVINDNMRPRLGVGDYSLNFSADAAWSRDDRKLTSVALNGGADGNQTITIPTDRLKGYTPLLDYTFKAKAGNTVTPVFGYTGSWMHGYVYLDRGNDGEFSFNVNSDNTRDTSADLMAYSYYNASNGTTTGRNSAGNTVSTSNNAHNVLNPPAFTIPADLAPGFYRMRYKVDWNDVDAGGCITSGNNILSNGGGIVDVMLNVHADQVSVTQDNRNGEVLVASTGLTINNDRIPFGQDFKIRMNPSNGFEYRGIRVRHGYNLTGDSIVKSNPQYRDDFFYADEFGSDDTFTIPGSVIDGDVLIEGLFVEAGASANRTSVTYNIVYDGQVVATNELHLAPGASYPTPSLATEVSADYYSFTGLPEGTVGTEEEVHTVTLVHNLPFRPCTAIDENTAWYVLSFTSDRNPLIYNADATYINGDATSSATRGNEAARWAFVGNAATGFKIVNFAAGEGKVLSSTTAITSSNDGSTYPTVIDEPVPDNYNTYWVPTKSTDIADGFYLHQLGFTANKMNKRDGRLAYWVSGAGSGSTFTVREVVDGVEEVEYCEPSPVSGRSVSGTVTNRTDRSLTNFVITDGVSSVTVNGGGSNSGRQVYTDRTSTVFATEAGKEVTVNATGVGFWVNTFLYVDFNLDGLDVADRLFSNFEAGVCNVPTMSFSFTVPQDVKPGTYRARFIHDWENTDPCKYGQSGSDNGELALDFTIRVDAFGTVTALAEGPGEVELWSKLDAATMLPAADAVRVASGEKVNVGKDTELGAIILPEVDEASGKPYEVTAIVVDNGDDHLTLADNADAFVVLESATYPGAVACRLSPVNGDVTITAVFANELASIVDIIMNGNGGDFEIYNIQGMLIPTENVTTGYYIIRSGDKTSKVFIRK